MQTRHRVPTIFNLSMVDVLCCALGCVILLWLVNFREAQTRAKDASRVETALTEAGDRLAAAAAKLQAAESELTRLREEGRAARGESRLLLARLDEKDRKHEELSRGLLAGAARLAELEDLLKEKNTALANLTARVKGLTGQVEEARQSADLLRTRLTASEGEAGALAGKLTEAEKRALVLGGKLTEAEKQAALKAGKLADAEAKVADLTVKLAGSTDQVQTLTTRLTESSKQMLALQEKLAGSGKDILGLTDRMTESSQQLRAMSGRLTDAEKEAGQLRSRLADADKQVALLKSKLADSDGQVGKLSGELTASEKLVAQLEEQLARMRADGKDSTTKLTATQANALLLRNKLDKSLADLEAVTSQLTEAQGERDRLRGLLSQGQSDLARASKNVAELRAERGDLETQRNLLAARNRDLTGRFAGVDLLAKKAIFLIDVSGSMVRRDVETVDETKWPQVCETIGQVMRSLPDLTHFQVIVFSDSVVYPLGGEGRWFKNDPDSAADHVVAALKRIQPDGGTKMRPALAEAFRYRAIGLDTIYLISDGIPNTDDNLPAEAAQLKGPQLTAYVGNMVRDLLKSVWNRPVNGEPPVRIHALGFYFESPDVGAFLWALARENGGNFVGMSRP